ncbi:hypothetical protein P8452_02639 [Trifolium repens]|nr:hypothetical protein P8452_02639 [Trifolium repens]
MSDNFWNRNQNASDSNGRRRRIVFALYVTNALGNDGPRRRGRGRGRGRMPNMPPQRREVDLPKWENQDRRRPYYRRPRKNVHNLLHNEVQNETQAETQSVVHSEKLNPE